MSTIIEETLGQLAAKDLQKAKVFKKYGLDFCCGGKKTVKEACADKGLDVATVEQELQNASGNSTSLSLPFNEWSLDFLCDYIVNTHHHYVKKTLPDLEQYARKVAAAHGKQHPELTAIYELVTKIVSEMSAHMIKEEKLVFPYIKNLINPSDSNKSCQQGHFGSLEHPITLMEMEHEEVGKHMEEIRKLSNNYTLPRNACASYTFLYRLLEEFEEDLHIHVHLENNILFAKATQLEKSTPGHASMVENGGDWDTIQEHFKGNLETIDVRKLKMPSPLITILEALSKLPSTKALFVLHNRIPVYLFPELADRKFDYRLKRISETEVHLVIFKK